MEEETTELNERPVAVAAASEGGDLRETTLELLDFQAIRRQLADHTTFFPARQLALELLPSYEPHEVEDLQRETAEGRALLERVGEVSLRSTADISPIVTRAALEGLLTGLELLEVTNSLEVYRHARGAVLRAGVDAPLLVDIAEGIPDLQELTRQIRHRIGRRGEVLDDATPTLRDLRRQVRDAYERVTQALTRIIQSAVGREALQDQVISIRGDRLVVQVKTEMRHRVPGIVHDASNTGATLFVEPFATVELCNAWRELALGEEREVTRVLRDLSTLVGVLADDIRRGAELVARLDFILARARYSAAIRAIPMLPKETRQHGAKHSRASDKAVHLLNVRHPLLGEGAVPINISIGPEWSALVITGPNTGGKTVAMKTVGLVAAMHQSGLQVPADEGSSLPVFDAIYADVGDQQSIERSVSTFSSHMRRVIDILAQAGPASLVLLDELGTSTDPEEGSALAKAVLGHLASRSISTIATTHHRTVAAYVQATPGMMNASVQLDASTLRPTYHLTMGIPGRSYAMSVASRMGLPEEIMDKAQSLLEPQYLRFEDWLNELQDQREQLQNRLQEAEQERARTGALRQDLEAQLEYLVTHREDILDSMRRDLLSQYEDIRQRLRRAEAALSWSAPPGERTAPPSELDEVKSEVSGIRRELQAQKLRATTPPRRPEQRPIAVGDLVHVRGLNLRGTVLSLAEQDGGADVNIGNVRLRIDLGRLSLAESQPEEESPGVRVKLGPSLSTPELDLRGMRAEEALVRLEEFLDKVVRDGLSSVRIIHGRGTGALRQAVREHLPGHPLARSFAPEPPERGGDGATVVELA